MYVLCFLCQSIIHVAESQCAKRWGLPRRRHRLEMNQLMDAVLAAQAEISQEKGLPCAGDLCGHGEIKNKGTALVAGERHGEERGERWVSVTSAKWKWWVGKHFCCSLLSGLSKDAKEKVFQGLSHTPVMVPSCVWLQRGISRDFGGLCCPGREAEGKMHRLTGSRLKFQPHLQLWGLTGRELLLKMAKC